MIIPSLYAYECKFQILEQDGSFFLVQKLLKDLPQESEVFAKKIRRRGLQEVEVKSKDSKVINRKARIRSIYDSKDKEVIERMLRTRCPQK